MKQITIGFSPCPNDTYIFDALINKRIDTGDYIFKPVLEDVEKLNKMAVNKQLDITKISVAAFAGVSEDYIILESGSALGSGVGPLLVGTKPYSNAELNTIKVAIPGKYTTANLLLSIFFPQIKNKIEMLFSDIENQVISGNADAGLLIHEGRFTYIKKNLIKLYDLGEVWEKQMNAPLPLGCICAKRDIPDNDRLEISNLIKNSILFAKQNPFESKNYIKQHSQEMADEVIEQHINLYVNEFSVALGLEGKNAIEFLLKQGFDSGLLPPAKLPIFN